MKRENLNKKLEEALGMMNKRGFAFCIFDGEEEIKEIPEFNKIVSEYFNKIGKEYIIENLSVFNNYKVIGIKIRGEK
ncbi:MAG: hypothetical protein QW117_02815 [Candidatus Pacearchaeota archaeon]